ncbi:MAG: hypothetical protein ACRD3G_13315 [Vicinamibacterales bacterium]
MIENRLAVRTVAQIAVEAVREASPDLTVAGVMPGDGGTNYVEILINVEGWDSDGSQITVGAFRNTGPAAFKKQISDSIQRRLHESPH